MGLDLEALGLTQEELQERVVDQICKRPLSTSMHDYETGEDYFTGSVFEKKLLEKVQAHIDATVARLADAHVLPGVSEFIETLTLQHTNKWGEKQGNKITFIEYLVKQAENYLTEKVNYEGKPKTGCDSFWKGDQTRVAFMIHQHLHYSIKHAVEKAVQEANSILVDGLRKTVEMKLEEISKTLKVSVQTK